MEKGRCTLDEILTQSDAWAEALAEVGALKQSIGAIAQRRYSRFIFTGCGSSYYLSLAAATFFQAMTGICAQAVPSGELLMNPEGHYAGNDTHLFVFSRSGTTSEVIESVQTFKAAQAGDAFSLSVYENTPLESISDYYLPIRAGAEKSIAQTRAFTSMYVAITAITTLIAGRPDLFEEMKRLPDIGQTLLETSQPYAREVGENLDFDRFYFLGSGERYGLACEGNLKMKEMAITHTEPFPFLEFRHGPISMVDENTVIVGLLSESYRAYEAGVLDDAKKLGACIVSLSERDANVSFDSALPEGIRNVLYLPPLQLMAFYRSIKKGFNPDRPRNLNSVVYLEQAKG